MATSTGTADSETLATVDGVRRRVCMNIAAVSAAGVGGLVTLVPLISQMAPSKDVLAESTTELDISAIEPGQAVKAVFRKQPVFVRNLTPDSDDMALCEAIIGMAHRLGMKVVAEGVETETQRQLLLAAGCDYAQGYLYSVPVNPDEFERLYADTSDVIEKRER